MHSEKTSVVARSTSRSRKIGLLVAAAVAGVTGWHGTTSVAATYTWANAGTDWGTATDWNPNTVPTSADTALFIPQPAASTTQNPSLASGAQSVGPVLFADNPALGNYTLSGANTLTVGAGGVAVRGVGTTTINGSTLAGAATGNLTFNIGADAGLALTGGSTASTNAGQINLYGSLTINNTATNNLAPLSTTGVIGLNGGAFSLVGNSAGGTVNVGPANATAATAPGEGFSPISVSGNTSNPTTLNFSNASGALSLRTTTGLVYDFVASGGITLGTNGFIKFGAATVDVNNGVISNGSTNTVGFAIATDATGTNFATYSQANGVVAATSTSATIASSLTGATTNYTYTDAAGSDSVATIVGNSFNIQPAALSSSLTLTSTATGASTAALQTQALMLNDSNNNDTFTINAGSGSYIGNATKYVYVTNPSTTLATNMIFFTGTNPVDIVGPGYIVLTGSGSQIASAYTNNKINLVGGTLRASSTQLNYAATGAFGVFGFRGGVLEISGGHDGTGASADFMRVMNATNTAGGVNWSSTTAGDGQGGSGGFSAFGAAASVNINGNATPSTLTWAVPVGTGGVGTTGFVQDGESLIFGSTQSNARLDFLNPIALDNGTAGVYAAREVKVIGGAGGDSTNLAGVISGSSSTDFLKSGSGTLTLSAADTYAGATQIAAGTLAINGTNGGSASGTSEVNVASGATLSLISVTAGGTSTLINDSASLAVSGTAMVILNINGDTENVNSFVVNGVLQPAGVYSANQAPAGATGDEAFFTNAGSAADSVTVAVPEPASLGMLALGGLGLMRRRRRQRKITA